MNWGGASRAERVSRFGGDRVESDQMGRNKPPKPKKRPKPPKRKDGSICTPHSWSDWYGPSLEMSSTGGARNATPFRSECDEGRAGKEKMLRQGSCCASEPHVALSAAL